MSEQEQEQQDEEITEKSLGFFDRLAERCEHLGSSLCIGLDPEPRRLPKFLGTGPEAIYNFCVEIIEATADSAAAFKPNLAFFESIGIEGLNVLEEVLKTVPDEVPVILDAKRGDIGTTAKHYAQSLFDELGADAVTVNPYMGHDSVEPFLAYTEKGVYILCLTSNPGARDFQMHGDLFLRVARKVVDWNDHQNCGMVVGATKTQFLESILAVAPDVPLLIPGLGAQGGDLEAIMEAAPRLPLHHLLFNVSRSIIYASNDQTFGHQARVASRYYASRIQKARERTRDPIAEKEAQEAREKRARERERERERDAASKDEINDTQ